MVWEAVLFALALRFFFFDFVLFKRVRECLQNNNHLCKKLFGCPFCQGFWTGLAVWLLDHGFQSPWPALRFAFIMALLSLGWSVIFDPLIRRYEKNHDVPLL